MVHKKGRLCVLEHLSPRTPKAQPQSQPAALPNTAAHPASFSKADTHLHPNGLEESRVSEWKLHHLLDLSQLLSATSNVIIAHFIQRFLFILDRDRQAGSTQRRSKEHSSCFQVNSKGTMPRPCKLPQAIWEC